LAGDFCFASAERYGLASTTYRKARSDSPEVPNLKVEDIILTTCGVGFCSSLACPVRKPLK